MNPNNLLRYLQSSSACGLPLVKSKNKTDSRVTLQWIKYEGKYFLYVINGTKYIFKLVLKDSPDPLYVNSTSLYERDDITDIEAFLPTIVKLNNTLVINTDKEMHITYYSETVIDFEKVLYRHSKYLQDNYELKDYLFKIPVDSRVIKLFTVDNTTDNKVVVSNSLHNINRKFLDCYYLDGFIYTNCPPVYVVQGLSCLLPRLENQINKVLSPVSKYSYFDKEDEKKRDEVIKATHNLLLKLQG